MRTFKIENNDLVIDAQGDFIMVEGKDEEVQCVERILTTNTGEWFLNILHGLVYEYILTKPFDEERARLAIIEAIYQETRVSSVEDVNFMFDSKHRHMDILITAKMQSGNTVEVVIPIE
ncbi:MAG: DUF2634 domain-containing protein [Clostridium sp.]|nr:DUF2634 domain-containing protein [Clostridium sp.]